MDTQMFINILMMLVAFFGGWFVRDIKKINKGSVWHGESTKS